MQPQVRAVPPGQPVRAPGNLDLARYHAAKRRIKKEALACDEWCKELTPSAELRKAFHGEAIDFAHFSQRYRQELDAHRETGLRLAALAQRQPLTLLYAAKNTEQNHARVLAAWLAALPVTI